MGNNFVNFPPPIVKSVIPVQVTAGVSATITVTGQNFGNNVTDVIGVLITTSGEIPCVIELQSDAQLTCFLQYKKGVNFNGNVKIGVATDWSGGQQNSTGSGIESKVKEFDPPAEIELTLAVDVTTIQEGTPARANFESSFKDDIALAATTASGTKVGPERVNITSIRAGSVIVVFVILPDPNSATSSSPAQVAAIIAKQANDPTSTLLSGSVTKGTTGVAVAASVLEAAAATTGTKITTTTTPEYFKLSEPVDYTLFNMEQCLSKCRRLCELGNEVPSIDGYPVLPIERPRVCKTQCMSHCGFGRPIVRKTFSV